MIPSLLQIPSAVSDSKLHSVLPNNGKGDFTFDRSTGATRINKDGLIEEVGYFSSELVQNGNFSELGSELVTNGDFSNGSSNWNIQAGTVVFINNTVELQGASIINQSGVTSPSTKTYKVTYTVKSTSGNPVLKLYNGSWFTVNSTIGTHTEYFVPNSVTFYLRNDSSDNITIDNVSVKQVDPNDRWQTSSWWTFNSLGAYHPPTTDHKPLYQETCVVGKKYLITFDLNVIQGAAKFSIGSNTGSTTQVIATALLSGSYRYEVTAAATHIIFNRNFTGTNNEYYVDNVSVVEVQGDRPRLSYDITNGVVEKQPHLLLEPSSTNFLTFSNDFSNTGWTKGNSTITANNTTSPEGLLNASKLTENTATSSHRVEETVTVSNGATVACSVFVKKGERKFVLLFESNCADGAYFNLDTGEFVRTDGTPVDYNIQDMKNGWYRCSIVVTVPSTSCRFQIYMTETSSTSAYTGDGSSSMFLYGAQVEEQTYATSYIPTAGTTITRAAETCNNSKPSVNSTEGVFYLEVAALSNDLTARYIAINDGSSVNRVRLGYNASVSNRFRALVVSGGSITADLNDTDTTLSDITQYNKIAFKYKANDFALYFNGTEVKTDTSGAVPTGMNQLDFHNGAGTNDFYGKVKGLAVYNEALTDAQLIELTS